MIKKTFFSGLLLFSFFLVSTTYSVTISSYQDFINEYYYDQTVVGGYQVINSRILYVDDMVKDSGLPKETIENYVQRLQQENYRFFQVNGRPLSKQDVLSGNIPSLPQEQSANTGSSSTAPVVVTTGTLYITAGLPLKITYDAQKGLMGYQTLQSGPYAGQLSRMDQPGGGRLVFNIINDTAANAVVTAATDQPWLRSNLSVVKREIVVPTTPEEVKRNPSLSGGNAVGVMVWAEPAGLAKGEYTGNLTISGNFANSPIKVPVILEVLDSPPDSTTALSISEPAVAGSLTLSGISPNVFYINKDNYFVIEGSGMVSPILASDHPAVSFSEVQVNANGTSLRAKAKVGSAVPGVVKIRVNDSSGTGEITAALFVSLPGSPVVTAITLSNFQNGQADFVIIGQNLGEVTQVKAEGINATILSFRIVSDTRIEGKMLFSGQFAGTGSIAPAQNPQVSFTPHNGTLVVNRDAWSFVLSSAKPGDVLYLEAWKDGVYMDKYKICTVPPVATSCSASRIPTAIDLGVWTENIYVNNQPHGQIKVTVVDNIENQTNDAPPVEVGTLSQKTYHFSGLPSGAYREGSGFVYKDFVIIVNYFGSEVAHLNIRLSDNTGLNYTYTKDNLDVPLVIDGKSGKKTVMLNVAGVAFPVNDAKFEYHPSVNVEITSDQPIYVLPPVEFSTSGYGQTVFEATENAWQAFGFSPPTFSSSGVLYVPYAIFWRNFQAFPDGWDTKITLSNLSGQSSSAQVKYIQDYRRRIDPNTCASLKIDDLVVKKVSLNTRETKSIYLSDFLGTSWNDSYLTEGMLSVEAVNVPVKVEVIPLSNGQRVCPSSSSFDDGNLLNEKSASLFGDVAWALELDNSQKGILMVENAVGVTSAKVDTPQLNAVAGDESKVKNIISKVDKSSFDWQIENPFKGGVDSVMGLLAVLANFIFQLGIPVAVIIIIYSGVTYLTAGNTERVKRATDGLKWAAIGLAILLIGKGFVALIQSILSVK